MSDHVEIPPPRLVRIMAAVLALEALPSNERLRALAGVEEMVVVDGLKWTDALMAWVDQDPRGGERA